VNATDETDPETVLVRDLAAVLTSPAAFKSNICAL
jgi:hypothetical protein